MHYEFIISVIQLHVWILYLFILNLHISFCNNVNKNQTVNNKRWKQQILTSTYSAFSKFPPLGPGISNSNKLACSFVIFQIQKNCNFKLLSTHRRNTVTRSQQTAQSLSEIQAANPLSNICHTIPPRD